MAEDPLPATPVDLEAAWARFCDGLKSLGKIVTAPGTPTDDVGRAETFQFLTHALRNNFEWHLECASPDFPYFFRTTSDTQRLGNADAYYLMSAVRGTRDYIIRGTRGSAHMLQFSSYASEPVNGSLCTGTLDAANIDQAADGSFEIRVSSTPQSGNWLPMQPETVMLQVRNMFMNRNNEVPADVKISTAEPSTVPDLMTSALLEKRLEAVLKGTTKFAVSRTGWFRTFREQGWINSFGDDQDLWQSLAAVPEIHYLQGTWDLADNEALVIESDSPDCRNWVLQINNCMMEALDYRFHRISMTKGNVVPEADGKLRIILAGRDPGVPNWLETAGHNHGAMVWRWISPETKPQVSTQVVKLEDLGRHRGDRM